MGVQCFQAYVLSVLRPARAMSAAKVAPLLESCVRETRCCKCVPVDRVCCSLLKGEPWLRFALAVYIVFGHGEDGYVFCRGCVGTFFPDNLHKTLAAGGGCVGDNIVYLTATATTTPQVEVARSRHELKARAVAALEERKEELTAETARNANALPALEQEKKVRRQHQRGADITTASCGSEEAEHHPPLRITPPPLPLPSKVYQVRCFAERAQFSDDRRVVAGRSTAR